MTLGPRTTRGSDRARLLVALALLVGPGACRQLVGIRARPAVCLDSLLIDDFEDDDNFICTSEGKNGAWYTSGGSGANTTLFPPAGQPFTPTRIPGGRGASHYAAHFTGSGFTDFALMGFNFELEMLGVQAYNASSTGGITFWLKNDAPVEVDFLTFATVTQGNGGNCADATNCNNHFQFTITASNAAWTQFDVPFSALTQKGGTAIWNPANLIGIQFSMRPGSSFDVWVDDISFYNCSTNLCKPTCTDPRFLVSCPASLTAVPYPAGCRATGTTCDAIANWCADPLMIDDMEDGDGAICNLQNRHGSWYTVDDGTNGVLSPPQGSTFTPTPIPGGRGGSSGLAARFTDSGFTGWGALMGFSLNLAGGVAKPYDASAHGGVTFWMKTNARGVELDFPIPETTPVSRGGLCPSNETAAFNCDNHFSVAVTPPSAGDWAKYNVPFATLAQRGWGFDAGSNFISGSATWNPAALIGLNFIPANSVAGNDVWIDDIAFYDCSGDQCIVTCGDGPQPVACPTLGTVATACWPVGADCAMVGRLLRPGDYTLTTAWGSGPQDIWAAGIKLQGFGGVILHWNGTAWVFYEPGSVHALWGLWGSGPNDVWAVGDFGDIVHWDGTAWFLTSAGPGGALNDIAGTGPNDLWAVGANGMILHGDGAAWTTSPSGTTQSLSSVWANSPSDAWAVGGQGTVLHWDGSSWFAVSTNVTDDLFGVWASGPDDVWVAGANGTIARWNGQIWSNVASGTTQNLFNPSGTGPNDVWVLGVNDSILHWDGTRWSTSTSGRGSFANRIWASSPTEAWAFGASVLRWDGSTWSSNPLLPTTP